MGRSRSRSRGRHARRSRSRSAHRRDEKETSRHHEPRPGSGSRRRSLVSRRDFSVESDRQSRSHSQDRQSRSRSQDHGRTRSQRISPPRASRRSTRDDSCSEDYASDSKHKKRSRKDKEKKHKRSKKDKKTSKRSSQRSESPISTRDCEPKKLQGVTDRVAELPSTLPTESSKPLDAKSFFAQLQHQESSKQMVGTLHASGVQVHASSTMGTPASDTWECCKGGCGHKNNKYAPACNKCGAMKRLSEWR